MTIEKRRKDVCTTNSAEWEIWSAQRSGLLDRIRGSARKQNGMGYVAKQDFLQWCDDNPEPTK